MAINNMVQHMCGVSPRFAQAWHDLSVIEALKSVPAVVVCGLLKAGKSSLLNLLIGCLEEEHFRTGAARVTAAFESWRHNGVDYIDTPGIDASEADDEEAWQGLLRADQIVFAHHLRQGEMDNQEIGFLQQLLQRRQEIASHLIVVLTNLDAVPEDAQERVSHLREKLHGILGFEPKCFPLSVSRHRKGTLENKPGLVRAAGFEAFQEYLMHDLRQQEAQRNERRKAHYQRLQRLLVEETRTVMRLRVSQQSTLASKMKQCTDAALAHYQQIHVEAQEFVGQLVD